jgi:acyl-CoA thioesterase YciA
LVDDIKGFAAIALLLEDDVSSADQPPSREPALRTLTLPADANPNGDIFGGWVMAQMDLAGSVPAAVRARGRLATVAVEAMRFHKPVYIGDLVSCYAEIIKLGGTSITVRVETWARRHLTHEQVKVTEGIFIYVAIDEEGRPRPLPSAP